MKLASVSKAAFLCLVLSGILASGCDLTDYAKDLPANPPLSKISLEKNEIFFYPQEGVDWRSLVDLDIFGEFRPGMDFSEARRIAGRPSAKKQNRLGPYWVYSRADAFIVLGYEEAMSGGNSFKAWRLYAHPRDCRPEDLFHPSIAQHLKGRRFVQVVVLDVERRRPALEAVVRQGKVETLIWYS